MNAKFDPEHPPCRNGPISHSCRVGLIAYFIL
jgi:hypothetical protein